ncbi:acetolactate synthase-1/2/3 large subunit [Rhodobium orientis]|uniref:Thiamine pyrophosphate-binding protein n=1 Tax=Rhodobium orientis TaxID=34017 RepID=A0A327JSF0_9HYPH|nr:thiamine pyrophosphate-binding protein [Rhodobium orientis]MBB4303473.1 acetolactate synthase-1/2/3 large subunit [Rhodobium orientis]MBK5950407.1 thiamine pyrophosphate-binding protein [Rhodobium orientis]RAI28363.1 thiamine pyrophosphate-binding protein [Rhodobium orientis]
MTKTNERVVDTLIEAGVTRAFTLPGLGVTWSLPAFYDRRDELDVVLTRNEWIASIMTQVTGRLTGRPAVLMGQGPWLTTIGAIGILEAHFAGSPMVVLTETSDYDGYGQLGVYQTMTGDYGGADAMASLKPITKYCTYATTPEEAVFGTQMAVKHASLPRTGPAAVIMKTSIIRQEMPEAPKPGLYPSKGYLSYTPARPDAGAVARLKDLLDKAKRPVFIAGNGVLASNSGAALQALAEAAGIAVATSYNAKGAIAETSDVAAGMLGTWGMPTANRAVAEADLVVMLGASMGPDYTRFRDPDLIRPGDQTLVQVDIDPRNAGWVYPVDLAITGDVADVISMLAESGLDAGPRAARLSAIADLKDRTDYHVLPDLPAAQGSVHHVDLVRAMQGFLGPDDILALDAGSNRIWSTFGLRMPYPQQLLVPGGTGVMGWGGPAAAAAKLVHPDKRVTCLSGDGGFMMTLQVITTCIQQNLSTVFVVNNNSGLGMVRDNLGERRIAVDFEDIDFVTVAEGLGGKGIRVYHPGEIRDAIETAHRMGGPVVVDVKVDPDASHHQAVDNGPL